ncbi:MAG: hypothetical protein K0B37_09485 [Bacteroidales bacterium]|nr:hypothetical protein [Bacteroidales bacterium]
MNNTKKTIVAGTLIAGAVFGAANLNAASSDMFRFNELGSGSTVRANLLNQSETNIRAFLLELTCGEDAKKAPADTKNTPAAKKADDKSTEAKCGEGKCGEGASKDMKAGAEADTTKAAKDSKSTEAKCGEGKCGTN